MTPQELRNSILQEAICGRLVKQRPEDEIEVLVSEEQKRIKKEILDEDDIEIPHTWNAAPLSEVVQSISSKPHQILESQVQKEGIYPVISQSKEYIIGYTNEKDKVLHLSNPVVIFGDHTTEVKIVDFDFVVGADGVKIFSPKPYLLPKFFYYVLQFLCTNIKNSGEYTRHYKYIKDRLIPLPPLAEQRRIVAKIEELIPMLDQYELAWTKLDYLDSRFPSDIRASILQEAIRGGLVEQRPEEGTAEELYCQIQEEKERLVKEGKIKKEKPLPEITEEEELFEIPETWKWVKLGDLLQVISGVSYDKKDISSSGYRILRGGNIQQTKILLEKNDVFLPEQYRDSKKEIRQGDILIVASTGSKTIIGKPGFVDHPIPNTMIGAFLRICRSYTVYTQDWLKCLFSSEFYREHIRDLTGGTNINNIRESYITEFVVPLPPLKEQKRIVNRLDELLALCSQLKGRS